MTTLAHFLKTLSVPDRDVFAARVGTSAKHLTNISYGYKLAGEKLAVLIHRETRGRVTCDELRPDVPWNVVRKSAAPRRRRERSTPKAAH